MSNYLSRYEHGITGNPHSQYLNKKYLNYLGIINESGTYFWCKIGTIEILKKYLQNGYTSNVYKFTVDFVVINNDNVEKYSISLNNNAIKINGGNNLIVDLIKNDSDGYIAYIYYKVIPYKEVYLYEVNKSVLMKYPYSNDNIFNKFDEDNIIKFDVISKVTSMNNPFYANIDKSVFNSSTSVDNKISAITTGNAIVKIGNGAINSYGRVLLDIKYCSDAHINNLNLLINRNSNSGVDIVVNAVNNKILNGKSFYYTFDNSTGNFVLYSDISKWRDTAIKINDISLINSNFTLSNSNLNYIDLVYDKSTIGNIITIS